jgi:ATP-dependent DNA helicase RecQ
LPFLDVIEKVEERQNQKSMVNSSQQARNVDGSFAIISKTIPDGPVLLIDDMADSRWTFTVAAWLLRSHGSGEVFPLALAYTGHAE